MKFVKLKDLCDFEKGATGLAKAEPGDYPLVTTGAERKSCNTYQFDDKAVCIPLVSSTGHGHASLKNVHYQEGKFALGSILVALTSKDGNKLDIQFLHLYLSQLKDQVLVPLMSGAANVALSVKKIQNIEIPLPSIDRQREIVGKFKSIVAEEDELKSELTHQKNLLKQLRQQILQEAIKGKLTADWRAQNPDIEPASELLKRISAEKVQLVKDKKIKAQPLLPTITDEEKPFELPQGWEWCRLADLGVIQGGGTPSKTIQEFWGGYIPWICPKDMKKKYLNSSIFQITPEGVKNSSAKIIDGRSILFVVRGMILSHTFPVSISTDTVTVNQDMKALTPYVLGIDEFIALALLGSSKAILKRVRTSTHGTCRLESDVYFNWAIALPSFEEQQVILVKVENLLAICEQLETQITQNQSHAEQLMQTVLKEAFVHNSEAQLSAKNSKVSADTLEVIRA